MGRCSNKSEVKVVRAGLIPLSHSRQPGHQKRIARQRPFWHLWGKRGTTETSPHNVRQIHSTGGAEHNKETVPSSSPHSNIFVYSAETMAVLRLAKEAKDILADPPVGVRYLLIPIVCIYQLLTWFSASPLDDADIMHWRATILGPQGSPYTVTGFSHS